jgi:hypothetical protein
MLSRASVYWYSIFVDSDTLDNIESGNSTLVYVLQVQPGWTLRMTSRCSALSTSFIQN